MRHDYEPLQPLPDVEFTPDGTADVQTISEGVQRLPAEVVGNYAVVLYSAVAKRTATGDEEYAVIHRKTGACFCIWKDLRVARNFAQEMDDCVDFDAILAKGKSDRGYYQDFLTYFNGRVNHPAFIGYKATRLYYGDE